MTSCSTANFNDTRGSRDLVQADIRKYSKESQETVRKELTAQKCLPEKGKPFDFKNCTIPTIYTWLIDYHKMREQTKIATKKPEPEG